MQKGLQFYTLVMAAFFTVAILGSYSTKEEKSSKKTEDGILIFRRLPKYPYLEIMAMEASPKTFVKLILLVACCCYDILLVVIMMK